MPEKIQTIIEAFNEMDAAAEKLSTALAAVDLDKLKPKGRDFIQNMCCFHNWIEDALRVYRSEIIEAEAIIAGVVIPITEKEFESMRDESGILRGAE